MLYSIYIYAIHIIFQNIVVNAFMIFMNAIHNVYECFQYVDFSTTSHANLLYTYYSCVKSQFFIIIIGCSSLYISPFCLFSLSSFPHFVTFFVAKCNSHSLNMLQAVAPISDDSIYISWCFSSRLFMQKYDLRNSFGINLLAPPIKCNVKISFTPRLICKQVPQHDKTRSLTL